MISIPRIKLEDYDIGRTVGRGGFGRVKIAKNKRTTLYMAIKLLSKSQILKSQQMDHVFNEISLHSALSHPFIVRFEGLAQDSKNLYLVMEFINGGQLFRHLQNTELTTDNCRFYAAIVVLVFQYMHSKNIVYRDLKPENLLIGKDGYLKLADFGFAKTLITGRTFTICGTPEYMAPEVIKNSGHGKAADWWTLGVLIYQMHAGIDPFRDDDPMGIYQNILRNKIYFPKSFDKDAKSLVKHLLVADLSKRYGNLKQGAEDIKNHRWMTTMDWNLIKEKKIKAPYEPRLKNAWDVSNFDLYPESFSRDEELKKQNDPFLNW